MDRRLITVLVVATACLIVVVVLLYKSDSISPVASPSRFIARRNNNIRVIVFVHGVIGNSIETWTNATTKAYWPLMMANDDAFSNSDIFVFGYTTKEFGISLSINELAEQMRRTLEAKGIDKYSELIFLSHSMGGLITQEYILKNRDQASKVKMLYFLGTPFEGSALANLAGWTSKNPQFRAMRVMESDSSLADLQRDWHSAKLGIPSFCAYERLPFMGGVIVVDQRSAAASCTEPLDPVLANHADLAKPADESSDVYLAFQNAYQRISARSRDVGTCGAHEDAIAIDPKVALDRQIQLFAEDKVRLFDVRIKRAWLGEWFPFHEGELYMVIGEPGQPITPRFEPMPPEFFKVDVQFDKYCQFARDIHGVSH
jgi:pimeloyl-ACP methyl ester carboxylesterase